jgi:hypothetical protein
MKSKQMNLVMSHFCTYVALTKSFIHWIVDGIKRHLEKLFIQINTFSNRKFKKIKFLLLKMMLKYKINVEYVATHRRL